MLANRKSPDESTSAGNDGGLADSRSDAPSLYHVTLAGGNDTGGRQISAAVLPATAVTSDGCTTNSSSKSEHRTRAVMADFNESFSENFH